MVWVDSMPEILAPILGDKEVLELVDIHHTTLMAALTSDSIIILDKQTLLPITSYTRTAKSVEQQGKNQYLKTKSINVDAVNLERLGLVNLFLITNMDYLIIYQINIPLNSSVYEIHREHTGDLLQKHLPVSEDLSNASGSIFQYLKDMTKTFMSNDLITLENIENFNNQSQYLELQLINNCRISVYKILKISNGINNNNVWIKANSHNIFINNMNIFQIINIKNLKEITFNVLDFEWYTGGDLINCWYNLYRKSFMFTNEYDELWYLSFGNNELNPEGYKLGVYKVWDLVFNPKHDLLVIKSKHQNESGKNKNQSIDDIDDDINNIHADLADELNYDDDSDSDSDDELKRESINLKLYKFTDRKLTYLNDISFNLGEDDFNILWSSNGEFFILLTQKGYWLISSKLGNITTNTYNLSLELNHLYLPIQKLIILNNNHQIVYCYSGHLYKLNLTKAVNRDQFIFNNLQYLMLVDNSKLIKFPLLNNFKRVLINMECTEGNAHEKDGDSCHEGKFIVKMNDYHQFIMSYGNYISVSTPMKTGNKYNHVLWYNFKNYYMELLNIIDQFSYEEYLILVNRTVKEVDNNQDKLIDELIILNIEDSRYGKGGGQKFQFDSDRIVHRQKFNYLTKSIDFISESNQLIFVDNNNQLVIIDLLRDYFNESDQLKYSLFIKVGKIINLKSFLHGGNTNNNISEDNSSKDRDIKIKQFRVIHAGKILGFLILLDTSELLLIKNQFNKILMTHYYQLVKLGHNIESIIINLLPINEEFINYLLLISGDNTLLIYNLMELVDLSFDNSHHLNDGIKDININLPLSITPIRIDINNFEPIKLITSSNNNGINLVGIEDNLLSHSSHSVTSNGGGAHGVNGDVVGGGDESSNSTLVIKINQQLILNNLIKFDLINGISFDKILVKFGKFQQFNYCLELLLFNGLINNNHIFIKQLVKLIQLINQPIIFINCLRKIEFKYWSIFFKILNTDPISLMNQYINDNQMELGYKFLIIYLNLKTDLVDSNANLSDNDKQIILKIFTLLIDQNKFDLAFELCRFIKLLDPSSETLKRIQKVLQST